MADAEMPTVLKCKSDDDMRKNASCTLLSAINTGSYNLPFAFALHMKSTVELTLPRHRDLPRVSLTVLWK